MSKRFHENELCSGGLAEIVDNPSYLTLSLFNYWLTGKNSLGKAYKLLNLPIQEIELPLLFKLQKCSYVILPNEEKTLYHNTVFKYCYKRSISDEPKLIIDLKKIIKPGNIINSVKILNAQSKLTTKYSLTLANDFYTHIPNDKECNNPEDLIEFMKDNVWPYALAIGYITNFYSNYLAKTDKNYSQEFMNISKILGNNDWLLSSIKAKNDFIDNKIRYEEFITEYGNRSDKDYEISEPRWKEYSMDFWEKLKSDENLSFTSTISNDESIDTSGYANKKYLILKDLLVIRSKTRKKVLFHFNKLRRLLIKKYGMKIDEIELDMLKMKVLNSGFSIKKLQPTDHYQKNNSGKGIPVSSGKVSGEIIFVTENTYKIKNNCIGIFPNPGTSFTNLYNKCNGIIFLTGGAMSHGCIVAREFSIPAIIDNKANPLKTGQQIEINGNTGEWRII